MKLFFARPLLVLLLLAINSHALQTVTNTLDDGPGSLREAVANAAPFDTIAFAAGARNETIILTTGQIVIDGKRLLIRLFGSTTVTITTLGNTGVFKLVDSSSRFQNIIFSNVVSDTDSAAVLIEGGDPRFSNCTFLNCEGSRGGAIHATSSSATFENTKFTNNAASVEGGAIYEENSSLSINECFFSENRAPKGGAIYRKQGGGACASNTFKENEATNQGGAIFNEDFSGEHVEDTFENNVASIDGGAVFNFKSGATFTECIFRENEAKNGGALAEALATTQVQGCFFVKNKATSNGGGASVLEGSSTVFNGCLFKGQTATTFGACVFFKNSPATLRNCVFQNNLSEGSGGAVAMISATPEISNCTFQGNVASVQGGALYIKDSDATINNTLIWNNEENGVTSSFGASLDFAGSSPMSEFFGCLIENWSTSDLNSSSSLDGNNPANDPRFLSTHAPSSAPLSDGGDHRLEKDSPAIDSGDKSSISFSEDYFGNPRTIDQTDIGAFEFQGPIYVNAANSGGNQSGSSWSNAFAKLQDALAVAGRGRRIYIAAGTYYPDEMGSENSDDPSASFEFSSKNILFLGGFPSSGNPTLAERDPSQFRSILSGDIDQSGGGSNFPSGEYAVIRILRANDFDQFDGLTIADGIGIGLSIRDSQGFSLTDCIFENNLGDLGGCLFSFRSHMTIERCIFRHNEGSSTVSGPIHLEEGSTTYRNCVFKGNRGGSAGAVYSESHLSQFTNCTFQGNSAGVGGGALHAVEGSSLLLGNCIIWDNTAMAVTLSDYTIAKDASSSCLFFQNLIEFLDAAALGHPSNLDGTAPENAPLFIQALPRSSAPAFSPSDLRLRAGSPAIDAGDNNFNDSPIDLLGNPRREGTIDLGAYERPDLDYEQLWLTDLDNDGATFGVEIALGTNPDVAEPPSAHQLRFGPDGSDGGTSYQRGADAPFGTIWKIMRSPDLAEEFTEIYRYDGINGEVLTSALPSQTIDSRIFVAEPLPHDPRVFFRLEAEYDPDLEP